MLHLNFTCYLTTSCNANELNLHNSLQILLGITLLKNVTLDVISMISQKK